MTDEEIKQKAQELLGQLKGLSARDVKNIALKMYDGIDLLAFYK